MIGNVLTQRSGEESSISARPVSSVPRSTSPCEPDRPALQAWHAARWFPAHLRFYCLSRIHPTFCQEHPPLISEEEWIAAAKQFIKQEGAEEFLKHLLANLKGEFV
jgi:hypothetical protein